MSVGTCQCCDLRRELVGMLVDTRNGRQYALCEKCTDDAINHNTPVGIADADDHED